jgi:hypothetical protein
MGIPLPSHEISDEERSQIDKSSSQGVLCAYSYPGMYDDLRIEKFSEQRHPLAKLVGHTLYYMNDPIDDRKKEMIFPRTIFISVDKYFRLEQKGRSIINSVLHLICNGVDIQTKMKSLSFLSFVSAIETMVNYEYRDRKDGVVFECHDCQTLKESPIHCKKCGRPIWGVKAKFKEYLQTYVSKSDGSVKKFNKIYNLRSQIVHNGMLLLGDEQLNWSKNDKANEQFITHLETMQLARLSLVNWLLMGPNKVLDF